MFYSLSWLMKTENELHCITWNAYLPVLPEGLVKKSNCAIGRHDQRGYRVSYDQVFCQPAVSKSILGELKSKIKMFWTQYGVRFFPAKSALETKFCPAISWRFLSFSTWNFASEFMLTLPSSRKKKWHSEIVPFTSRNTLIAEGKSNIWLNSPVNGAQAPPVS